MSKLPGIPGQCGDFRGCLTIAGRLGGLMNNVRRHALAAMSLAVLMLAPVVASAEGAATETVKAPAPVPATPPSTAAAPPAAPTESAPSAAGSAWNAEVAPAKSGEGITLDAHQTELVEKVGNYFKELSTLQGSFVQTGSDNKRMKGKFYVKRPGRFRFDYARPSRQIVISDGRYLAVQDLDLNNEDRVALDQTPFRLLLRSDVNLVRDARIMEVQESDDMIILSLEDKDPDSPGQIRLFLATKPGLELKEWVTHDAQGLQTRVEVSDLAKSVELDANLFTIKPVGKPMASP
jgi:outer membrane lipoprotein-sorting protein